MTDLDRPRPVGRRARGLARPRAFVHRHAGLITASTLALVWLLLARSNPETTYHLAPLLVAASWGGARRWVDRRPGSTMSGLASAGGGGAVALVTTGELSWVRALEGPVLWGVGSALGETIVFLVIGSAIGFRFVTRSRGGLLFEG